MIIFAGMLEEAAKRAGIKVPPNPDKGYDPNTYPHFSVFCSVQLCRPLTSWGEHWENAEVVAAIPEKDLKTITLDQLLKKGLRYST